MSSIEGLQGFHHDFYGSGVCEYPGLESLEFAFTKQGLGQSGVDVDPDLLPPPIGIDPTGGVKGLG